MLPLLSKEKLAKKNNHSKVKILGKNVPLSIYMSLITLISVQLDNGLYLNVHASL